MVGVGVGRTRNSWVVMGVGWRRRKIMVVLDLVGKLVVVVLVFVREEEKLWSCLIWLKN